MMRVLVLRNRQKVRALEMRAIRRLIRFLLESLLKQDAYELGFHFVAADEMAAVNQTYLQHEGSTDVITFDYFEGDDLLHGEIFISIDDAIAQAKQFRTTWQSELARYIVHGVLHLRGFDDLTPVVRKKMKLEENRLLHVLTEEFSLSKLQRKQVRK